MGVPSSFAIHPFITVIPNSMQSTLNVSVSYFRKSISLEAKNFAFYLMVLQTLLFLSGTVELNPGPVKSKVTNLSFAVWNLDSIPARNYARIPLIETFQSIYNFDIFGICESLLNNDIPNEDIFVNGFSPEPFRADKPENSRHGGVCLFFKENLPIKERCDLESLPETIVAEVKLNRKKIFFVLSYCHPNLSSDEFEKYTNSLEHIYESIRKENPSVTILTGDFNARSPLFWEDDIETREGRVLSKPEKGVYYRNQRRACTIETREGRVLSKPEKGVYYRNQRRACTIETREGRVLSKPEKGVYYRNQRRACTIETREGRVLSKPEKGVYYRNQRRACTIETREGRVLSKPEKGVYYRNQRRACTIETREGRVLSKPEKGVYYRNQRRACTIETREGRVLSKPEKGVYYRNQRRACTIETREGRVLSKPEKDVYYRNQRRACTIETREGRVLSKPEKGVYYRNQRRACTIETREGRVLSKPEKGVY